MQESENERSVRIYFRQFFALRTGSTRHAPSSQLTQEHLCPRAAVKVLGTPSLPEQHTSKSQKHVISGQCKVARDVWRSGGRTTSPPSGGAQPSAPCTLGPFDLITGSGIKSEMIPFQEAMNSFPLRSQSQTSNLIGIIRMLLPAFTL